MKTELNARGAMLTVRTVALTRGLLKQLRKLRAPYPQPFMKGEDFDPERMLGWFDGIVLGDAFTQYTVILGDDGDVFLVHHKVKGAKQIYV